MRLLTPALSSAEEEREADSDGADVSDVSCGRSRSRWAAINMRSKMLVAFLGCGCAAGGNNITATSKLKIQTAGFLPMDTSVSFVDGSHILGNR